MHQTRPTRLFAAALVLASGSAFAVEFSIEGKLGAIQPEGAVGLDVKSVKCNGSTILLTDASATSSARTVYSTPSSADLSKADFFSIERFPGFAATGKVGLLGGTCIIDGNSDASGNLVADKFFGEPAENVLVGPVSTQAGQRFSIMGVPIVLLTDDTAHMTDASDPNTGMPDPGKRIKASSPINQFGYPVVLGTVPRDDLSAAEGYLAPDGIFYAFSIETTGGNPPVANNANPLAPTVQRGTMEFRNATSSKLEIRGGCTIGTAANGATGNPPNRTQPVRIVVDSTTTSGAVATTRWIAPNNASSVDPLPTPPATGILVPAQANASCTEDAASPGSGTYRFRVDIYTYGGTTGRAVPVNVKVGIPGLPYGAPAVLERIKFP